MSQLSPLSVYISVWLPTRKITKGCITEGKVLQSLLRVSRGEIVELARETLTRIGNRVELIVDRRIVRSGLSVRGESEVTWLDCPQVGLWQCDAINLAGNHRLEGEIIATAFSTPLRCVSRLDINERMMNRCKSHNWKGGRMLDARNCS